MARLLGALLAALLTASVARALKTAVQINDPGPTAMGNDFGTYVAASGELIVANKFSPSEVHVYSCNATACTAGSVLKGKPGFIVGSVAVYSHLVIVGDTGNGVVYVYGCPKPTTCTLGSTLEAPGNGVNSRFGQSVAVSGTRVVVGAPFAHSGVHGEAYLFSCPTASTCGNATVISAIGLAKNTQFGNTVAVSGSLVVVGDGTNSSVSIFTCTQTSCTKGHKVVSGLGVPAIGISGHLVVVGSIALNNAWVFSCPSESTCSTGHPITPSDLVTNDGYGWAVGISGVNVVVGAPFKTVNNKSQSGAAYRFICDSHAVCDSGVHIFPTHAAAGDQFGFSAAVSTDRAVIGAPPKSNFKGTVYTANMTL